MNPAPPPITHPEALVSASAHASFHRLGFRLLTRTKPVSGFLAAWAAAWLLASDLGMAQVPTLAWVPVGNPGNANDSTGYGGVAYDYMIGKYEVTNSQWRMFLTAMASVSDPNGLYNSQMSGIDRTSSGDLYAYTAKGGDANWDNRPVDFVSWHDAARFCNWLTTGNTENGVYLFSGGTLQGTRDHQMASLNFQTAYFIPTENEWYKAAYHKNDGVTGNYFAYPTSSDTAPSATWLTPDPGNHANFNNAIGAPYNTTAAGAFENSASPYGTFDQGGNLREWNESSSHGLLRGNRGGSYSSPSSELSSQMRYSFTSTLEGQLAGFRVACIIALPLPANLTTTYAYDDAGRLVRADQPTGQQVFYGHDAAGNLAYAYSVFAGTDADGDGMPDHWEICFLGGTGVADATTDTDHDGRTDLMEYALAGDPTAPDTSANPAFGVREADGKPWLTLTFRRNKGANLTYKLEASENLETWQSGGQIGTVLSPPVDNLDGTETVVLGCPKDVSSNGKMFLRLAIPKP